jgi:hypothetical protein
MNARTGAVVGRTLLLAMALCAALAACTKPAVTSELRPDGVYHLKCKETLQVCLNQADLLCQHQRYVVLRALDLHNYSGDSVFPTDLRESEAFVRCGFGRSWGDVNKAFLAEPLCPAGGSAPAPSASTRLCTPGASQACAGPAGCKGGQACAADGSGFGQCDCGPAPAP